MQKVFILILTLSISECIFSQTFFEGDITYKFDLKKKDSSFDETTIITYPAKTTTNIYKDGNWLQKPDDGMIEYSYFNHSDNKNYWKLKGTDTLFYELGNESREGEVDSTLKSKIEYNTDTILGFVCNRLIIQTQNLRLTIIYSPSFAINPAWYQNTKMGCYNVIYSLTKSVYLKSIVETNDYISEMVAQEVNERKILDAEFPDISKAAFKKL
jgi:hypothetical protein